MLAEYRRHCATIGQQVRVLRPAGDPLIGRAADVDATGQLVVDGVDGRRHTVSAGDVVHVRPE